MKRVFALAAVAALSATAVFAQDWDAYVRIGAYNPFNSNIVGRCDLGQYDISGAGPYPGLTLGVLPGDQDFITDLFLSVHVNPQFLTGGQNPSPRWSTLSFSITYDTNYIDLIFVDPADGSNVLVSSLNQGAIFSPFIDPRSPAIGTAAGQVNAKDGSLVTVTFALAHTSNSNGIPTANGYLRDWFQNDYDSERLRVLVKGSAIKQLPDQTYRVAPGLQQGNIIIQVRFSNFPGDSSRNVIVDGCFVVPEPASMIALGSGLVGLLALRRRRSN